MRKALRKLHATVDGVMSRVIGRLADRAWCRRTRGVDPSRSTLLVVGIRVRRIGFVSIAIGSAPCAAVIILATSALVLPLHEAPT
jgi:hypothetical protein